MKHIIVIHYLHNPNGNGYKGDISGMNRVVLELEIRF